MKNRNLVIGYHGCDADVATQLLLGEKRMQWSKGAYEWLGFGMYFWENNLERAKEWANTKFSLGRISKPAVVGALLDLGHCCDFADKYYLDLLGEYYQSYCNDTVVNGEKLPVNSAPAGTNTRDKVCRQLDCAVIEHMHDGLRNFSALGFSETNLCRTRPFDSVRGIFLEGEPVFEGSDIYRDTHIQICVRNPDCIVGFFLPRDGEEEIRRLEVGEDPAEYRMN